MGRSHKMSYSFRESAHFYGFVISALCENWGILPCQLNIIAEAHKMELIDKPFDVPLVDINKAMDHSPCCLTLLTGYFSLSTVYPLPRSSSE